MEDNTAENKNSQKGKKRKKKYRRWIFPDFVKNGSRYSLFLSLGIFAAYTAGSMPDPGFPDHILFFLLRMLLYSSLLSCAFSLFAMGYSVRRMVYRPSVRHFLRLFFYFITAVIGANLALFGSLIAAATEGNI